MEILITIGLWIAAIVLIIGIIRVILAPYTGFVNFLLEIMLLDYLWDLLFSVFDALNDD